MTPEKFRSLMREAIAMTVASNPHNLKVIYIAEPEPEQEETSE